VGIVDQVFSAYGGASALARLIGISRTAVSLWRKQQRVPVTRVLEIERLTGIPRHKLRPDIYPVNDAEATQ